MPGNALTQLCIPQFNPILTSEVQGTVPGEWPRLQTPITSIGPQLPISLSGFASTWRFPVTSPWIPWFARTAHRTQGISTLCLAVCCMTKGAAQQPDEEVQGGVWEGPE